MNFFTDLCHVQAARAAGEVGRICAELVYGYQRHPRWAGECDDNCYEAEDLDALEAIMPGIASYGRGVGDTIENDGTHPDKAGPCAKSCRSGFVQLRARLDGCLTGSRLAKDRAAARSPR